MKKAAETIRRNTERAKRIRSEHKEEEAMIISGRRSNRGRRWRGDD